MDFKQLQTYIEVVRYKSFTKAAEKTGMSQPSISAHIRALETEVNAKLIVRTTKTLDVTPCGQEFYEYACTVIGNRERLLHRWEEAGKSIRLGVSTIPSAYIVPEILPEFQRSYPGITFDIHQTDSHNIFEGILSGRYDIGLVGMQYQEPRLSFVPFYRDRMVLITPATEYYQQFRLGDQTMPVVEEILSGSPVILRETDRSGRLTGDRFIRDLGVDESRLNIVARVNDQETIKNLVHSGIGVSIVSETAVRDSVRRGNLLSFSLPPRISSRDIYIAMENREPGPLDRNAAVLAGFIQKYYSKNLNSRG